MSQRPWCHRTCKRLRYGIPPLPQSLLARLVFTNPRFQRETWSEKDVPFITEDDIRKHFSKHKTHKSQDPDNMCSGVLRELTCH